MAKGKQPEPKQEPVIRLTPFGVLNKLLKLRRSTKNEMDSLRGTYAESVGDAVENKHLHKKAWASVVSEDRMEPEALKLFYAHQDHYRTELGLYKRAESAELLPMDDETEGEEKTNVKQFPAPTSVAAE